MVNSWLPSFLYFPLPLFLLSLLFFPPLLLSLLPSFVFPFSFSFCLSLHVFLHPFLIFLLSCHLFIFSPFYPHFLPTLLFLSYFLTQFWPSILLASLSSFHGSCLLSICTFMYLSSMLSFLLSYNKYLLHTYYRQDGMPNIRNTEINNTWSPRNWMYTRRKGKCQTY